MRSRLVSRKSRAVGCLGSSEGHTTSGPSRHAVYSTSRPGVLCAVLAITDTQGTFPAKFFERLYARGKEPDTSHPAYLAPTEYATDFIRDHNQVFANPLHLEDAPPKSLSRRLETS